VSDPTPTSPAPQPIDSRYPIADRPSSGIPRRRGWLHLGLFVATFVTLSMTGGYFWEGLGASVTSDAELLDPTLWTRSFLVGIPYGLWVLAILGAHEMGHYLACRYYGIPATLPFFIPAPPLFVGSFGALIRIRGRIPHRRALFDVAAAGPIAGFAIAFPLIVAGLVLAEPSSAGVPEPGSLSLGTPVMWYLLEGLWPHDTPPQVNYLIGAGWVGMLVTSLNLFPVGQLDGGHAAYAISRRLHRVTARASLVALLLLVVYHGAVLRQFPAYTLWFAILLWMRDRHPRLLDETEPLDTRRRFVALALLAIFVLSFIPVPLIVHDA